MLLKHSCSPVWTWEPEICERCSLVRLFYTGFRKFSGLLLLCPPLWKEESLKMPGLTLRYHKVRLTPWRSLHLTVGVGEAEVGCCRFEIAHTCRMGCLCLSWDVSTELRHCLDANPLARGWCLGETESITLGDVCSLTGLKASTFCWFCVRVQPVLPLTVGLKPGGVSRLCTEQGNSTESIPAVG